LLAAFLVAACASTSATLAPVSSAPSQGSASSAPSTSAASSGALTPVKVQLGFKYPVVQWYSIYHLGKDKGFFAKYGVDPQFIEGTGSANSIQVVANGQADLGAAISTSVVMQGVGQGAPVKMVAQETPVSTIAVLSRSDAPIKTPADLAGKKIGYAPGTYSAQLFQALLAANNVDPNSITVVNVPGGAYATSLAQKQVDGYISAPDTNVDTLKSIGVTPVVMNFRDFGVDPKPQEGIVASDQFIQAHPDLVKGFLAGLNDTIEYAMSDPAKAAKEAASSGVAAKPESIKADIAESQMLYHLDYLKSGAQAGQSPLKMSDADMQALETLLTKYAGLASPQPLTSYYTNDFVPQQ